MKKWVLIIVVMSMVITSLFLGGQARAFERNKGYQAGELLCGVLGGVALGAIANNLVGKDPVTFVAAIIGGVIGARTCDDLNNEEKQAVYALVRESFSPRVTGTHHVVTNRFDAFIDVTAKGWRTGVDAASEDCLYFRASVYEPGENGKFLGRTSAYWACGSANGSWQVVSSGVQMDKKSGYAYRTQAQTSGYVVTGGYMESGKIVITEGTGLPVNSNLARVWNLKNLPRYVYDPGAQPGGDHMRPLQLMNRDKEIGYLKAVTKDGIGGAISVDIEKYQPDFNEDTIGVECDYTNYCVGYNLQVNAKKSNGTQVYKGYVRFIFKNGDVGIRDSYNGWSIIPAALAR